MALAKSSKTIVAVLTIIALSVTLTTLAAINTNKNVNSSGTVTTSPNIGVYSNSACTTAVTSINWGSVAAGSSVTQTVYLNNTGTGTLTLSIGTSNWSPSGANTYLNITWNQQGIKIAPAQVVAAKITLTVFSNVTGITNFSNTIAITGTC